MERESTFSEDGEFEEEELDEEMDGEEVRYVFFNSPFFLLFVSAVGHNLNN